MPSESKSLLTTKTEKPNHYSYLKEFRVEQCPLFLQHKCTQHRPFTCFHWHFNNQRRRRPVRKRDGTFNYSADTYCGKYDETTGNCPDGDECQFLHRTAGDTERRYHLRYYKTCMCVHDTDSRGYCTKNGPHCAFAHGINDLRPPVYDIKEMQENPDAENGANNGPNVLDKERNLMNEDPKWQDTSYVLSCYKTEPCKRPPRLCRQGYACPQYHNSRDKRRSPRKYKYRSTPCPDVKHGDEWGEPSNCESGDGCAYCHTRTEQQFHPEIYKSTKCNDVQTAGYCPRGVFCAFAHLDQEMSITKELATPLELSANLADILSSALPSSNRDENNGDSPATNYHKECLEGGVREVGDLGGQINEDKASSLFLQPTSPNHNSTILSAMHFNTLEHDLGFDDLNLDEPIGVAAMERDYEADSPTISNSISAGLTSSGLLGGGSAPVNIPGSTNMSSMLGSYSPSTASPLQHLQSAYLLSRYSHPEHSLESGSLLTALAGSHGSAKYGSLTNGGGTFESIMSPSSHHPSPSHILNSFPVSPTFPPTSASANHMMVRLREEVAENMKSCEEQVHHARESCEIWQKEVEEANRKVSIAEQQRDEAMNQAKALQKEVDLLQGSPYLHGIRRVSELKTLPLNTLKSIQAQLKSDLEQVDKELHMQTGQKCLVCEERNRSVTLGPCNHYVLCTVCAPEQKDCPYCQTTIIAHSKTSALHA